MKNENNNLEQKNKLKRKTLNANKLLLVLLIACIVIIIMIIIFIQFIYPKNCIDNINNNYDLQQYDKVSQYSSALSMIEDYLKNDISTYNQVQYKVKLSESLVSFENNQFDNALNALLEIKEPDEIVENKINDCKYELGKKYIEDKQYDKALEYLQEVTNKEDLSNLLDNVHYNLSVKFLEKKDYKQALEEIEKVTNKKYENLENLRHQIYYQHGNDAFKKGDYNSAISYFESADDYKDAKELVNNAYIKQAEEYIEEGKLKDAKLIYDYLPDKAEYDGIKASKRKKQLNKIKDIINVMGRTYAAKSYSESRNVWRYDGRWNNWYIDKPNSSEYIDIDLELNDDGTVTLEGTAYFSAFNNFSSLQEYCKARIISRTIKIKNITSIPSTYKIDENTKLLYSNGTFKIEYSKRDDYSTSFYNVYSSSVTY